MSDVDDSKLDFFQREALRERQEEAKRAEARKKRLERLFAKPLVWDGNEPNARKEGG